MRIHTLTFALLALLGGQSIHAQGLVDLSFDPGLTSVGVGDTFDVRLFATAEGALPVDMGALDAILVYDPAVLTLLGSDQTGAGYAWFAAGFLPDPDNINADIADGQALFTALAQFVLPAVAPPVPGLQVTTFQFQALAPSAGSTISMAPMLGSFGKTRVLAFTPAGLEITGDISDVANVVVGSGPLLGAFCSGDGSGTPCPCGANGAPGAGCANSAGALGATLVASGLASISNDTFQLQINGVPGNKPGLVLRGANQLNAGAGTPVGDGLLCAVGQSARSHVQITSGGSTLFTHFAGQSFGATSYGVGTVTNYQFWYRDPQGTCSGEGFNFTNAWGVIWQP